MRIDQRYTDGAEIHAGDRVAYNGQRGRVAFVADRDEFEAGWSAWNDHHSGVMIVFENGARLLLPGGDELLVRESERGA